MEYNETLLENKTTISRSVKICDACGQRIEEASGIIAIRLSEPMAPSTERHVTTSVQLPFIHIVPAARYS